MSEETPIGYDSFTKESEWPHVHIFAKMRRRRGSNRRKLVNKHEVMGIVGRGGYAQVLLARDWTTPEEEGKKKSESKLKEDPRAAYTLPLVALKKMSKSQLKRVKLFCMPGSHKRRTSLGRRRIPTALDRVRQEINLMMKLNHPNLLCIKGVFDDPREDSLYIKLELCGRGNVMTWNSSQQRYHSSVFRESGAGGISEGAARYTFYYLLRALLYLWTQGIIHRDVKPDNLLVGGQWTSSEVGMTPGGHLIKNSTPLNVAHSDRVQITVKLCDLGVSNRRPVLPTTPDDSFLDDDDDSSSSDEEKTTDNNNYIEPPSNVERPDWDSKVYKYERRDTHLQFRVRDTPGTYHFFSAEACKGRRSGYDGRAADLWAAGVTLYCMLTGCVPFITDKGEGVLFRLIKNSPLRFPKACEGELSDEAMDLVAWMLQKNPTARPSVTQIFTHPWMLGQETRKGKRCASPFKEPTETGGGDSQNESKSTTRTLPSLDSALWSPSPFFPAGFFLPPALEDLPPPPVFRSSWLVHPTHALSPRIRHLMLHYHRSHCIGRSRTLKASTVDLGRAQLCANCGACLRHIRVRNRFSPMDQEVEDLLSKLPELSDSDNGMSSDVESDEFLSDTVSASDREGRASVCKPAYFRKGPMRPMGCGRPAKTPTRSPSDDDSDTDGSPQRRPPQPRPGARWQVRKPAAPPPDSDSEDELRDMLGL